MASPAAVAVDARCALCGTAIDAEGTGVHNAHAVLISLYKHGGSPEGYLLCQECGLLAGLPSTISLN
jgi:hypothetical protein